MSEQPAPAACCRVQGRGQVQGGQGRGTGGRGTTVPTRHQARPEQVERAIALIQRGYSVEIAGAAVGLTGKTVRNHLRRRGLSLGTLRPGGAPLLYNRYPCRYCDGPAREPGGVCTSALCRKREWASLSDEERAARVNQRRRAEPDRSARQVGQGRRVDVHILLTPDAAEQLRDQASMRRQSMSSLIAETLADAGIISEA